MRIFLLFILCVLLLNCSTSNLSFTKFYKKEKSFALKKCKINERKFIKIAKKNTLKENFNEENYNFFCEHELIKYDVFLRNTSQIIDSLNLDKNYIILNREYKSSYNGFSTYRTILIVLDSINRIDKYSFFDENKKRIRPNISDKELRYFEEIEKVSNYKKSEILANKRGSLVEYYFTKVQNKKIKTDRVSGLLSD